MKRAVVTGAGSGIGREVALRLVKRGYEVVILGRRKEALLQTARDAGPDGERIVPLVVDVTDAEAMMKAFEIIDKVSVVVASAGICRQSRLGDPECGRIWKEVMSVNVDGVWNTFNTLFKKIENDGRVVVVSSGLGKLGRPGYGAYAASKHAVLGLVKCLAFEFASKKITVNAVCPGWVETEMSQKDLQQTANDFGTCASATKSDAIKNIPLGRFVEPSEAASLIDWLTSKEAGAVTGQAYNISCGEFFA